MEKPGNTLLKRELGLSVPSRLKARPGVSSSGEVPCIVDVSLHLDTADMPRSARVKKDKFRTKL